MQNQSISFILSIDIGSKSSEQLYTVGKMNRKSYMHKSHTCHIAILQSLGNSSIIRGM
jgi:hypothetical protein